MEHKILTSNKPAEEVMDIIATKMAKKKKWKLSSRTTNSLVYTITEKKMGCGMASLGLLALASVVGLLFWYMAYNSIEPEITNSLSFWIIPKEEGGSKISIDADGREARGILYLTISKWL